MHTNTCAGVRDSAGQHAAAGVAVSNQHAEEQLCKRKHTCSCMDVMDSAAMRSAKMAGVMRLPHSRATEVRRGNSRATHVSTIIHLFVCGGGGEEIKVSVGGARCQGGTTGVYGRRPLAGGLLCWCAVTTEPKHCCTPTHSQAHSLGALSQQRHTRTHTPRHATARCDRHQLLAKNAGPADSGQARTQSNTPVGILFQINLKQGDGVCDMRE